MPEEKVYIGTKIIKAYPIDKNTFDKMLDKDVDPNSENALGYCVTYEDGYKSWSPKATFEHAYREVSFAEKRFFV
jgi:hypothetical protein